MRIPNRENANRVAGLAKFEVGDIVVYRSGMGNPIGNGSTVTVVRVSLDHNHIGGHLPECFRPERVEYDVAIGYNSEDGTASARWRARASEVFAAHYGG